MTDLLPGDVLCTRSPKGWPAFMIRLGAALLDRPNTVNHVIVMHHVDAAGTPWGIEARPGGVGQVDVRPFLKAPYTVDNREQPKTPEQRAVICEVVDAMRGYPYDWVGIGLAAMEAIHADRLWHQGSGDVKTPPAHVICSSLADWAYDHVGLASPGALADRSVTPGDWAAFITEQDWKD